MVGEVVALWLFLLTTLMIYGWWLRYRWRTFTLLVIPDPVLASARPDSPVIVYFSNPTRLLCQTRQLPMLEQLRRELQEQVQIIEIDVTQAPDVAERWGVVTTPITFVLDTTLQTRHVNDGVASIETLKAQLSAS